MRAELDERDVAEIKVGQAASIRAAAFPDKEFAGTVTSIAPLVEPSRLSSRGPGNRADVDAVEVLVKLAQPGPLTAGMKVDVYFGQEKPAEAIEELARACGSGFCASAGRFCVPAIDAAPFRLDLAGFVGGERRGRRDTCPSSRTAAPPR